MTERLGSVYDDVVVEGERGPDLRWRVTVPPSSVGDPAGVAVVVPFRLETDDGVVVDRAVNPADEGTTVRIQVPTGVDFPVTLRLRGLGGTADELPPGDLYLRVAVADVPMRISDAAPSAVLGAGLGVGVIALLALFIGFCA